MGNKPQQQQRNPSVGQINLVEDPRKGIMIVVNLEHSQGTDPIIFDRIRSSIAGLAYVFENDQGRIETLGKAYIDGLEEGIKRTSQMNKRDEHKTKKSSNYKDTTIGFHGNGGKQV